MRKTMTQLQNLCAFRAGWQVFHAGRHDDYPTLNDVAKAGYEAARRGDTDWDRSFDDWRRPALKHARLNG